MDEQWCTGKAECLTCGHVWQAVWPLGADALECPGCGGSDTVRDYEASATVVEQTWEQ